MHLSGYRFMWVVVLFDLPVDTKKARRDYTRFRKKLLKDGFTKMQFSVYIRHCASKENAEVHTERVSGWIPDDGEVRVITITDKQFERMRIFWGKRRKPPEKPPAQLEFF
jgi:CRISPR-associated protein Cas2